MLILLSVFFLGQWFAVLAERNSRVALPRQETVYEAVVLSEPVQHGKVIQCDLYVMAGVKIGKVRAAILRDTLTQRYLRLHVGDALRAQSLLEQPDAPSSFQSSQNHFDYGRWLRTHDYRARTYIPYRNWSKVALPLSSLPLAERLRLRAVKTQHRLQASLRRHAIGSDELGVIQAMTLGDRSMLSRELRDTYSIAAASHVLALSGLHLTILYAVLLLLLVPFRHRWWVQPLALSTVWVYVWVVGMSPSVVRSATMLTIYGLFSLLHRRHMPLNVLSLAAIVMLLVHSYSLFDVGFQLSFLSIVAILLFVPLFTNLVRNTFVARWHLTNSLYGLLAVSCAAQLGTAPLVAYYFGRISCYFLLTNLLAIPLVTIILWLALAFFLMGWWPLAQSWLAACLDIVAHWLNCFLAWVASLPGASVEGVAISGWQVVTAYLLVLLFYTFWRLFDRKLHRQNHLVAQ